MDFLPKEPPEFHGMGPGGGAESSSLGVALSMGPGPHLVAHPRAKSKVWRYFGFDTDSDGCIVHWKRIYCRVCMSQIAYSGNTSNLSYHLEKNHPAEFGELVKSNTGPGHHHHHQQQHQQRVGMAALVAAAKLEPQGARTMSSSSYATQPALEFGLRSGFAAGSVGVAGGVGVAAGDRRRPDLTRAVCDFVCEGMHPVSVVEEPTFRALLRTADPRYAPPTKHELAVKLVPRAYERAREAALAALAGVTSCGVTTDLWRSPAHNRAYVTLSVHAVTHGDGGFATTSKCLKTFEVPGEDPAETVTRALYEALAEWGVVHKVSGVTTDGSPDVVKACSLLELSVQMPCLGHALSRGVAEAFCLPRAEAFLAECRKLVEHFRETAVAGYALREQQRRCGVAERRLVADGGGGWLSTLAMLQRLKEQRAAVAAALADVPAGHRQRLSFETSDWARLEGWVELLQPVQVVMELMAACRYPTISMVRPVLHMLQSATLATRDGDLKEIATAKEVVTKALAAAYSQPQEVTAFLNVAAFLDPRYKRLPFLSVAERAQVEAQVVEEAKAVLEKLGAEAPPCPGDFSPPPPEEEPLQPSPCKKPNLNPHLNPELSQGQDNPLAAIFCQSDSDQTQEELHAQVVEELGNYKSQRLLGLNEDPLVWWTSHAPLFPTLPRVLQKYWCVPATNVPCHRLFGAVGDAHAGKRARLAPPALVDQQVFLYENARGYHDAEPNDEELEDAILWDGGCALMAPLE